MRGRMTILTTILEFREIMRKFISAHEKFISIGLKFILTFISLYVINGFLGYNTGSKTLIVYFVVSIICSALPVAVGSVACAMGVELVLLGNSPQMALIMGAILVLMVFTYLAYIPDNAMVVQLTLLFAILGIPYLIPVCVGMFKKPHACIATGFGMGLYYVFIAMKSTSLTLVTMNNAEDVSIFNMILTQLIQNKEIIFAMLLSMLIVVVVFAVRNIKIDYAWQMAAGIGILGTLLAWLVADYSLQLYKSMISIFGGCILSAVIIFVIGFILYHRDYARTEYVQFEDEEYYYYVKAVPKVSVAAKEKQVQNINKDEPIEIIRDDKSGDE